MKIAVYSSHAFDREFLSQVNSTFNHDLTFFDASLTPETASLAKGIECVCCFVSDQLDAKTLSALKIEGVKLIALRSAGYNHVDLPEAKRLGLRVVRVPAYSPYSVAEHAVTLLMSLNRHIPKAYNRVRDLNFSLDGLMGFDLHEKTVGVIGTGKIGGAFAKIMLGFGCHVLAYDLKQNSELKDHASVTYSTLTEVFEKSDVISLHLPLTPESKHLINQRSLSQMKKGVFLINTGRGGLIDSAALIEELKSGHIGGAALDVYEEEEGVFYHDLSETGLKDDLLARLLTFPNVLITSHQAFFTREALTNIAETTLQNIRDFETNTALINEVIF